MEEWKEILIGDLGTIITGKTPKTSIKENYGGEIPFLTPSDDMSFRSAPKTNKTITNRGLSEVRNCLLPKGAICVSCIGSDLGKVVITQTETVTNQQINSIILNDNYDVDFIYYLMIIVGKEINRLSKTSTAVPIINKSTFSNTRISVPSLKVQKRIASILKSLDDKIENNRKINENLEQQAQALFKSWFVDFEPFRDQPFVESELGMIPEGWRVGNLFDVAEILDKYRKPLSGNVREKMQKKEYPYYGATSCMDYVEDYIFDGIYTLIGEDGSVIKDNGFPFMQYVWGKIWVNNHAHILQGKNGFSTEMIYILLSLTNINHLVTGAVQAKLSQANMQKILVVIPPSNILCKFRAIIDSLFNTIRILFDESHHLSQLRDTLLPKLMSGEIKL